MPRAVDERIRILDRDHGARECRPSATRGAHGPVRPMWQHGSSVQYSVAPRARSPASRQREDLGVRPAGELVRAAADDHAFVVHDDGADHRVGAGASATALRERQRAGHVAVSVIS